MNTEQAIKILLVDDRKEDLLSMEVTLSNPNYTFYKATSGREALRILLKDKDFAIILIDVQMPQLDGYETTALIRESEKLKHIPIIFLTANNDKPNHVFAGYKAGAVDYMIKPIIPEILRAKVAVFADLYEKTNALYIEKQKLAEAQKIAHIGSWEWDILNKKMNWSDEFFLIHGIKPQEERLSPEILFMSVHPDDKNYVESIMQDIVEKGKQVAFTYRIIRKDGAVRTLYSRGEAIKSDKGEVIKIMGTGQDSTERIQEDEMEKLAMAATKSFNSVIITNEHGNIEWVNDGFTALTGYRFDEVKGSHGESLRMGAETGISENDSHYKNVIKAKAPLTYESKNYSKQGREYWTITTLSPVLDKNGEVKRIIAIDSDITPRKQMEETLLHANKIAEDSLTKGNKALNDLMNAKRQLEELVSVKEQFLANMSHEIRTPMNAIVGFTDLILKTHISQEQRQYIDAIKTSGENLLVIINDILDFSKIQSGKVGFEQIEFSISHVVSTLTELMLPKSTEKHIKLSKSIDKKVPDRLIGDPTRLTQILLNLVDNAIKFTEKGEVKISVELLSEDSDSTTLRFSVSDTGIGISKEKLLGVFDAFTQANNDTTRKYGGTGLGLAIVKQLVEMQGGHIHIESEMEKGSVLTYTLVYRKSLSPENAIPDLKENETAVSNDLLILLVEDNTFNQVLAQKVLSDWGWRVEVADNGLIAVEKMKEKDYDLVLMDIQMPEMDGYETTRHIREKLPAPKSTIPIIAMTAHAITGEEEKCFKIGMNGYISKPFKTETLYQKIVSAVNRESVPPSTLYTDN
jgi:PAS domain S-box-containing protein